MDSYLELPLIQQSFDKSTGGTLCEVSPLAAGKSKKKVIVSKCSCKGEKFGSSTDIDIFEENCIKLVSGDICLSIN